MAMMLRKIMRGQLHSLNSQWGRKVRQDQSKVMPAEALVRIGTRITRALQQIFVTGSVHHGPSDLQPGVCKTVDKSNTISHMFAPREVVCAGSVSATRADERSLTPTSYGLLCAALTPEGRTTGLVKELASLAIVRQEIPSAEILAILYIAGVMEERPPTRKVSAAGRTLLRLNGVVMGPISSKYADPYTCRQALRRLRWSGMLPMTTSVYVQHATLRGSQRMYVCVDSDDGVILRAVLCGDYRARLSALRRRQHDDSDGNGDEDEHDDDHIHDRGNDHYYEDDGDDYDGGNGQEKEDQDNRDVPQWKWSDLVRARVVELVSKDEELAHCYVADGVCVHSSSGVLRDRDESCLTQSDPSFDLTHEEIDPTLAMYGMVVSTLPLVNHNPAPRALYTGSMIRQAMEICSNSILLNRRLRSLASAQHPLVVTEASLVLAQAVSGGIDRDHATAPLTGVNVVVMVLPLPENQEDAIIVNRSALQRGLFQSYQRTVRVAHGSRNTSKSVTTRIGYHMEVHADQDPEQYDATSGALAVGTPITGGEILVLRYTEITGPGRKRTAANGDIRVARRRDDSLRCPDTIRKGVVESVEVFQNQPNMMSVRVVVRELCTLHCGDKLTSRHGQKGTIGRIEESYNLPFDMNTGITPDLVINPHAFPSRMTVGQCLEMSMAYLGAQGRVEPDYVHPDGMAAINGSAFSMQHDRLDDDGRFCGEMPHKVMVADGMSGRVLSESVDMGLVYYLVLEHQAADKVHVRSTGRRDANRQPTGGKRNQGGLRFGEMERDAVIAHGASHILQDRLCLSSDATAVAMCSRCQVMAQRMHNVQGIYTSVHCQACGSDEDVQVFQLPFAMKVLVEELAACHINLRLESV